MHRSCFCTTAQRSSYTGERSRGSPATQHPKRLRGLPRAYITEVSPTSRPACRSAAFPLPESQRPRSLDLQPPPVNHTLRLAPNSGQTAQVRHDLIRSGRIEVCGDSPNALAGLMMDLPDIPADELD